MKLLFFLSLVTSTILFPSFIYAQSLENSEIKLELNPSPSSRRGKENINIYKNVINDNIPGNITVGDKYTIQIPYADDYSMFPLAISIKPQQLNFGSVESGEPIIRDQEAQIFTSGKRGYTLFLAQNHALQSSSKIEIPNTTCDSGSCTSILSDIWSSPLTYGFGYTCENREICSESFKDGYYRRLASLENEESYAEILSDVSNSISKITFKLNTSPTQPPDAYHNSIFYILTPNF